MSTGLLGLSSALTITRKAVARVSLILLILTLLSQLLFAYEQEVRQLSARMAEAITKSGRKTVAVVDFTDLQGNVTELGRFLAEEFSVALTMAAKDFEVIDRTHLKTLLQEHKLASTGIIDPQTARKLGEIAGVQALVTGSITPFGDSVRLSAKVLDASTAKMISGFTADIPRTRAIEELLAKGISGTSNTTAPQTTSPVSGGSGAATTSTYPRFETESYRVTVESIRRKGSSLSVTLVFESLSDTNVKLSWSRTETYLLDENGERWKLDEQGGGNARGEFIIGGLRSQAPLTGITSITSGGITLLPGTKVRNTLLFSPEGQSNGTQFALAAVEYSPKYGRQIIIRGLK